MVLCILKIIPKLKTFGADEVRKMATRKILEKNVQILHWCWFLFIFGKSSKMQRNDNNAAPKHFPKSWCYRRLVQAAGHHLLKTTTPFKVFLQGIKANFQHRQLLLSSFIF